MACNGSSHPAEEQRRGKDTFLSPSVRIREQLKMKGWSCVQGQGGSFMSEGGGCWWGGDAISAWHAAGDDQHVC